MLCSAVFALLLGSAAALERNPVATAIDVDKVPTTLAELMEVEYKLVDKLFIIARDTIMAEISKSRTTVVVKAAAAKTEAEKVKVSAAAPAGAPGGPGSKPPFGPPKKAYLGINPAMKAKTGPIFQLKCAEVLEEMVNKRVNALAKIGHSNETIGIDMATHFQVQCPGSIPMPEDKCDDWATKLAKFIDAGKPIFIPPPAAPGGPGAPGAPGGAPAAAVFMQAGAPGAPGAPGGPGAGAINSGNDWCMQF